MTGHLILRIPLFSLGTACLFVNYWRKLSVAALLALWIQFQPVCPHEPHNPLVETTWHFQSFMQIILGVSRLDRTRNKYIRGRWTDCVEMQPERPDWHVMLYVICYQGGKEDILVKGCKLGGRPKRIFVIVEESLVFDPNPEGRWLAVTTPAGNGLMEKKKVFQWLSGTPPPLTSAGLGNTQQAFACLCFCVAWITVHTACEDLACAPSHMTDCLGVHQSGLAGCWVLVWTISQLLLLLLFPPLTCVSHIILQLKNEKKNPKALSFCSKASPTYYYFWLCLGLTCWALQCENMFH